MRKTFPNNKLPPLHTYFHSIASYISIQHTHWLIQILLPNSPVWMYIFLIFFILLYNLHPSYILHTKAMRWQHSIDDAAITIFFLFSCLHTIYIYIYMVGWCVLHNVISVQFYYYSFSGLVFFFVVVCGWVVENPS